MAEKALSFCKDNNTVFGIKPNDDAILFVFTKIRFFLNNAFSKNATRNKTPRQQNITFLNKI